MGLKFVMVFTSKFTPKQVAIDILEAQPSHTTPTKGAHVSAKGATLQNNFLLPGQIADKENSVPVAANGHKTYRATQQVLEAVPGRRNLYDKGGESLAIAKDNSQPTDIRIAAFSKAESQFRTSRC